ncbi:hypothetical protein BST61_g9772 [Cercospora zeina]
MSDISSLNPLSMIDGHFEPPFVTWIFFENDPKSGINARPIALFGADTRWKGAALAPGGRYGIQTHDALKTKNDQWPILAGFEIEGKGEVWCGDVWFKQGDVVPITSIHHFTCLHDSVRYDGVEKWTIAELETRLSELQAIEELASA